MGTENAAGQDVPSVDWFCCESFRISRQRGTDNEMYGPAIWHCDGELFIGCVTPKINFCPWCGAQVKQNVTHDPLGKQTLPS